MEGFVQGSFQWVSSGSIYTLIFECCNAIRMEKRKKDEEAE
jgi:hypothetical protein